MSNNLPPYEQLLGLAARQRGYFSARQAAELGVSYRTIDYWRSKGRFVQVMRGVYRLAGYFHEGFVDEVWPAWLACGADGVVSHESALVLHDLTDLMPSGVHLTLPYSTRGRHIPPQVHRHVIREPISAMDIVSYEGFPMTQVERTIVDCASLQIRPDQIEVACHQALERAVTTPGRLLAVARDRSARVQRQLRNAIEEWSYEPVSG